MFTGCSGAAGKAARDANSAAADDSGTTASPGEAHLSFSLDGQAETGNGVDELQQQNAAYIVSGPDNTQQYLLFYLFSTKDGNDIKANYSFRFSFPAKVGTFTKTDGCKCGITLNTDISNDKFARFFGDDGVVLTITSLTSTRVTGTFSGKFSLGSDTPRNPKKNVVVTDGKFDIPMATSKLIPS